MKSFVALFGLSSLLGFAFADAPIINAKVTEGVIENHYIVVYKDNANLTPAHRKKHEDEVNSRAQSKKKGGIKHRFSVGGFQGYTVEIDNKDLPLITSFKEVRLISCPIFEIARRSALTLAQIKHLEKDTTATLVLPGLTKPSSIDPTKQNNATVEKRYLVAQYGYNWGDIRISHRTKAATLATTSYVYDNTAGQGTWIYVVDTGVLISHQVSHKAAGQPSVR